MIDYELLNLIRCIKNRHDFKPVSILARYGHLSQIISR
jgi:hypothetical protein